MVAATVFVARGVGGRCVCPLAGSGKGPRGSLLSWSFVQKKTWLWNMEGRGSAKTSRLWGWRWQHRRYSLNTGTVTFLGHTCTYTLMVVLGNTRWPFRGRRCALVLCGARVCFEVSDQTFWLIYDIWRARCRGTADSQWHDTSSVAWGGGGWVESPSFLKGLFFCLRPDFFLCYDWNFRVLSVERDEWMWIIISVLLWFYCFFIFHRVPPHTHPPTRPPPSHRHLPPDVLIRPPC